MAELKPSDYVHLHNHTHYSLLDGLQKLPEMFARAEELGMEHIAITDHGTLSGLIDAYKASKDYKVKPIFGMETYVASRKHTDKDPSKDKGRYHLILLAMNNTGYENLMRLSTIANLDGFYHKPRIDHDLLEQYNEGLIVLSGCIGGELGEALRAGNDKQARSVIEWYKGVFGDRYYIEIQDHGYQWEPQRLVNEQLFKLAEEYRVPAVVTCDAHYLKHEDQEVHEILLCVQTGSFLADQDRMSLTETDLYLTDPKDLIKRWGAEHPDIITNTRAIAERCDVHIELGKILIPKFPVPEGEDEKSYLHQLVYQGLAWRYGKESEESARKLGVEQAKKTLPPHILERSEYELGVIDSMGFNGYFLIISDFIGWGKNEGIVFGPGRGSAAGSIVAFALKITELDPMRYGLLFERFLNPDRISMPDIDIDIQDTRRDEVIQYCVRKYGKERVANIVTFGTMAARAAVRDVARVLQVPYAEADKLAKLVPPPVQGRHIPLAKSIHEAEDLKHEYENNPNAKRVLDLATRLEGTIRSHGIHAAGVVIAPDDIVKFAPLEMAQKGVIATQYSMKPIEELGLLKMDFLGLSNLTIIKNALRIIKRVYGKDIDINNVPLDDETTFELLQRGETTGVFQLESAGMKRYLRELKPTVFEDIIAMVALYRPGPMQFIETFINRKHGREEISYMHQAMEPALKDTYGVLVYQEQVMQISKDLAGFTGGQADTLRKAIGKKQLDVMAKMKDAFIDGAVKLSHADPGQMEIFWKQLEDFAAYCFNKSHAACYGFIAYQTAYLKAHYPSAFMAALMTSDFDDTDRLTIEMTECKHMGIEVLTPDVNQSYHEFAVVPETGQIRFGLDAIKNVGYGAVEEIIKVRTRENGFKSLEDFVSKVSTRIVNRKAWESLVKAGAFDSINDDRPTVLANIDTILKFGDKIQKEVASGQTDLFGNLIEDSPSAHLSITLIPAASIEMREKLQWERELLGLYLSEHPLSAYELFLSEQSVAFSELTPELDGRIATLGGNVVDIREITTKSGSKMAFVKLGDKLTEIEVILFPSVYGDNKELWQPDRILLVTGKISAKDRDGNMTSEVKILAETVREISADEAKNYQPTGERITVSEPVKRARRSTKPDGAGEQSAKKTSATQDLPRLYLRVVDSNDQSLLLSLKETLDKYPSGEREVVLVTGPDSGKQIIKLPLKTSCDTAQVAALKDLLGETNVIIR